MNILGVNEMDDNLRRIIVKLLINENKEKLDIKPKSIQYETNKDLDNILNFKEMRKIT